MLTAQRFSQKLFCLSYSLAFFRQHLAVVLALGLIAALGRVTQLGGFGDGFRSHHVVLEIIVESARACLLLFVLGEANWKRGWQRVKRVVTGQNNKQRWASAAKTAKGERVAIVLNLAGFLLVAWGLNMWINVATYDTCFYPRLKEAGVLAANASEWTLLLFFKNLSVIPFTLIFETMFVLWLTKAWQPHRAAR